MDMENRLKEAIENGEVLRVTYAGGSQPGAEREIAPISIKNDKVRAQCYTSDAVKLFVIEKITLADSDGMAQGEWAPGKLNQPRYSSLQDVLEALEDQWKQEGWTTGVGEESLTLHRIGKRGKPLKTPAVSLDYEAETYESVMNLDGEFEEHNRRPRVRPWSVRAKGFETKTFKHLDAACDQMNAWASEIAPNKE